MSSAQKYKRLDPALRAALDPHIHLRHSNPGDQTASNSSYAPRTCGNAWSQAAFEGYDAMHPLPSVVIGTFADIGGAFSRLNEPMKGDHHWATRVARLVDAGSIDAVIIDMATQLWEGYALALLPKLTNVENIVLVGDEQLEPTEIGYISRLPSLLSSALRCSNIPHTALTESYSLSPSVAEFLFSTVYDGRYSLHRCAETSAMFDLYLQSKIQPWLRNPLAQALIQRLLPTPPDLKRPASLGWIHMNSPRYHRTNALDLATSPEVKHIASVAADLIRAHYLAAGRPTSFEMRSKLAILTPCSEVFYLNVNVAVLLYLFVSAFRR